MRIGSLFSGVGGLRCKPRKPKQYPVEMVARVSELYGANHTQAEVAAALGTTQRVVWRLMLYHKIKARPRVKRDQYGANNSSWRGGDAGYAALHLRVAALRGQPRKCEICGTTDPAKRYDWANISGNFAEPNDYKRMCRSCHWKHDKKFLNLGAYARRKGGDVKCQ